MTTARDVWSIQPTRLPDVCKALEIPIGKHHRALDDARACAKIILRAHRDGVRQTTAAPIAHGKQLELLPKLVRKSHSSQKKKLTTAERTKQLGNWGEKKTLSLLYEAGFEEVENLNDRAVLCARRESAIARSRGDMRGCEAGSCGDVILNSFRLEYCVSLSSH